MSNNPANVGTNPTRPTGANDEHWKKYKIYKIPEYEKALNPGAYSPQLVFIGPYNHGKAALQPMEEHKARALQRFMGGGSINTDECCQALESKFDELISSYQSLSEEWKGSALDIKNKFLMLMVKDGVFLYEFMRGYPDGVGWEYDKRDPVFSVRALHNIPNILADILMLENQLPLIVLERLIAVEKNQRDDTHYEEVNKLVLKFLAVHPPSNSDISRPLGLHVLDISRKVITSNFVPIPDRQYPRRATDFAVNSAINSYDVEMYVKSAINLYNVGVKFKKSEVRGSSVVSFVNATLMMPSLTFDSTTEPRFLNAIAFECLHPATNNEVSSYIAFLQGLIATPSDVMFLRSKDLIQSEICDLAVDGLMNIISKNVLVDPSSDLCKIRDNLDGYFKDNMSWKWRAREWVRTLDQTYFKNPWTVIAVNNAVVILIFTIIQTLYTIKDKN